MKRIVQIPVREETKVEWEEEKGARMVWGRGRDNKGCRGGIKGIKDKSSREKRDNDRDE